MQSLLIQLDDVTLRKLNQLAPAARRQRAQFVRDAIKAAIRRAEYQHIREAYRAKPDTESEADNWANAEEYRP